jgi:hypothetical protein
MAEKFSNKNHKKTLTDRTKIEEDYLRAIKNAAFEHRYGVITVEITVHQGKICGAELVANRRKLMPMTTE